MPVGTKVFLAIFALVIGVLIVYYGVFMPGDDQPRVTAADLNSEAADTPADLPTHDLLNSSGSATPESNAPVTGASIPADTNAARDRVSMGAMGDGTWSSFAPPAAMPEETVPPSRPPQDSSSEPARNPVRLSGDPAVTTPTPSRTSASPPSIPPRTPVSSPTFATYTVKPNDTLSGIALAWFGDAQRWELILEANPTLDPRRLQIGQQLRIPARDAARTAAIPVTTRTQGLRTYVVRSGDTLSSIAGAVYGTPTLWQRIYRANQRAIGADPDRLVVGMQLILPDGD